MKQLVGPRPGRFLDDFVVGEAWTSPSRTMTDTYFVLFSALTGDVGALHLDDDYASRHRFGKRVAHGLLLNALTALGASDLYRELGGTFIGFVEQSSTFRRPAFIGDTVKARMEVLRIAADSPKRGYLHMRVTVVNQDGLELLEGTHVYLVRRRQDEAEKPRSESSE